MSQQTPKKPVLFGRTLRQVRQGVFVAFILLFVALIATLITTTQPRQAQAATNNYVNFQARLEGPGGNIAADGYYNVKFRLYSASSGGSALWTEEWYDSNGGTAGNDNRIQVINGYLTASLGSQTAFPGTINWDQQLWITLDIGGTTQTATPTYDGEMSPRLALTGVPYAFRAGALATTSGSFTSTLSIEAPTGGNQTFQLLDQGAAGTYTLLTNTNGLLLQTTTPGTQQTGNFHISGTGIASALMAGSLDVESAGALTVGNGTATSINIGNQSSNIATTLYGTSVFKPTTGNDSTTAFQVQNALGSSALNVNTTPLNTLITNGSMEGTSNSNWAVKQASGGASVGRSSSQSLFGTYSEEVVTSTTSGDGAMYTPASLSATTYTLSFYIKQTAGTNFNANIAVGYNNGSDNNCTLTPANSSQAITTTTGGWVRKYCTMTMTGTPTFIYWKQTDSPASGRTFYIDGVQLETGSTAHQYQEQSLQLGALITSPLQVQTTNDSTLGFYVGQGDGTQVLRVDTLNRRVTVGTQDIGTGRFHVQSDSQGVPAVVITQTTSTGAQDLLQLYNNSITSNSMLTVANAGAVTLRNATDSTAGFQVQNAAATAVLTVDTTNLRVKTLDLNVGDISAIGSSGRLFSDDFESGSLGHWPTTGGTISAATDQKRGGKYAAKLNPSSNQAVARRYFAAAGTFYTRAYIYVTNNTTTSDPRFIQFTDNTSCGLGVHRNSSTGNIGIHWNGATNTQATSTAFPTSQWNKFEMQVVAGTGTSGSITLWLNGTQIYALTGINTSCTTFNEVLLGTTVSTTSTMWIDDLVVDTVSPGDSTSLSVADSFHVSGSSTFGGAAIFKPVSNTSTAFQVQNAAGSNLFSVDTMGNNVTVLSNNAGEPQPWTSAANQLTAVRVSEASAAHNGYLYLATGQDASSIVTSVQYSKIGANGAPGTWSTTSTVNTGVVHGAATVANGYLYILGGYNTTSAASGDKVNTVQYAKINSDGTLGTWAAASNTLPAAIAEGKAVTYGGYIYYVGGNTGSSASPTGSRDIYYAKTYPDGTVGAWSTFANAIPNGDGLTGRLRAGVAVANGYLYIIGGKSSTTGETGTVYYGKFDNDADGGINNNGLAGLSTSANTLPQGVEGNRAYVMNGYIYSVGGDGATDPDDEIYYSALGATGDVGSWSTAATANKLPGARRIYGSAQANGYIYVIGGFSGTQTQTVYYTSLSRMTVGGSLDLVGYSGENLAEGGSGGNLTAGNTSIVGSLQVADSTLLAGSTTITGDLRVGSAAYFQNATNSTTAFQIQNVNANKIFTVDTVNATVGIGTSGAQSTAKVWINAGSYDALVIKQSGAFNIINLQDTNDASVMTVNSTGSTLHKTTTNSLTAFQIQNASGNSSFTIDTINVDAAVTGRLGVTKSTATTTEWNKVTQTAPGTIAASGGNTGIDEVQVAVVYNGSLYVGTTESNGAEVYRYDGGTTWTRVSTGAGQIASGGTSAIDRVQSLVSFNGNLYAGTNESNSAEVYRYDGGTTWTKVTQAAGTISATGGSTTGIDVIEKLTVYGSSLYASTSESNAAEIYRYDGGTTWTKVTQAAGTISATGGSTTGINGVPALTVFDGKLYAGTAETNDGEVYRYDGGTTWTKVSQTTAGTIASGGTADIDGVEQLAVYNGALYAGTEEANAAEIYRYDGGTTWTKVSQAAGTIAASGTASIDELQTLIAHAGSLYAGTNEPNSAEIYRYSDSLLSVANSDEAGVMAIGNNGGTFLQNSTDSTTAFQVLNASGTVVMNVDATNGRVGIGTDAPTEKLEIGNGNQLLTSTTTSQTFEGSETFPTNLTPGTWTTGGSASWFRSTAQAYQGTNSAEGGNVANSQTTWLDLDYTFTANSVLKFNWMVNSETDFDYLVVCVDNDGTCSRTAGYSSRISGTRSWAEVTIPIRTAGSHSIRWLYGKDSGNSVGSDIGWIDNVRIIEQGNVMSNTVNAAALLGNTLQIQNASSAATVLEVNDNGYMGLGTGSPTYNLHVKHAGDSAIYLESDTDNTDEDDNPFIKMSQDGGGENGIFGFTGEDDETDPEGNAYNYTLNNGMLLGTTSTADLQFGTSDNVRMTIESGGDVGVGIANPQSDFSVSPVFYDSDTGNDTGSQSGTTVTGSGTLFTTYNLLPGMRLVWADGTSGGSIVSVDSDTQLTMSASATVSAGMDFTIHHQGFQVTSAGIAFVQTTSTAAFEVQNTAGTDLLTADTTNSKVIVTRGSNDNMFQLVGADTTDFRLDSSGNFTMATQTGSIRIIPEGDLNLGTIGTNNINLGRTDANITTTINGSVLAKSQTNSTTAFQLQNSSSAAYFIGDSANQKITTKDLTVGTLSTNGSESRGFTDGFESNSFAKWTGFASMGAAGTNAPTIDTAQARSGKYSAKVDATSQTSYATTPISTTGTSYYVRGYFYITTSAPSADANFFSLYNNAGTISDTELAVFRNTSGYLCIWRGSADVSYCSTTTVPTGQWNKLELALTASTTTTGSASLTMNDTAVSGASFTNQITNASGTAYYDRFRIGTNTSLTQTFWVDDIAIDSVATGDSSSLHVADSFHVAGSSSFGGQMVVRNTGSAMLDLYADSDNDSTPGEFGAASIRFFQDGGNTSSMLGTIQGASQDSRGNTYYGTNANSTLLGTYAGDADLHLGTSTNSGTPYARITVKHTTGNVGIGTNIPDNFFSVSPIVYSTGTAYQSGTTITGVGTSWSNANGVYVGQRFIFNTGTDGGTITAINSTTSLTVSTNQTVSSNPGTTYRIHAPGLQVTTAGNAYVASTSTTAFQVQNAAGTALLAADTTNADAALTGRLAITKSSATTAEWSKVSQAAGTIAASGTTLISGAVSSAVYNGSLYVGTYMGNQAEIYRYDGGTTWTRVSQSSAGTIAASGTSGIDWVSSLTVHGGSLYAATSESNSAEIYRYDGGTTWTRVSSSAGTIVSGGTGSIDGVWNLTSYNGGLYAGTNESNSSEIYKYVGGTTWTKVTQAAGTISATGGSTTAIDSVANMEVVGSSLYAGTSESGLAEVYRYDGGTTWTKVTQASGAIAASGTSAINAVGGMAALNGSLYVSTSKSNSAEVYRYDGGTTWTRVSTGAGQIASGGTSSIDAVSVMTVHNGAIYIGTYDPAATEIYRYDPATSSTTWTKVTQAAGTISATSGSTTGIDETFMLQSHAGSLYAGTWEASIAEVYRYSDNLISAATSDEAGVLSVGNNGNTQFQTSTDSTTAFQVLNASGTAVMNVDTTNGRVGIGTTAPTESLQVANGNILAGGYNTSESFEGSETFPGSLFAIPGATWTTGGSANWARSASTGQEGTKSAASGAILDSQSTWLDMDYTFAANSVLRFYWKVSSETSFDYLVVCVDNDGTCSRTAGYSYRISSDDMSNWVEVSIPISAAGSHSIRWLYGKDSGTSGGTDTAWIDNVRIYESGRVTANQLNAYDSVNIGTSGTAGTNGMINLNSVIENGYSGNAKIFVGSRPTATGGMSSQTLENLQGFGEYGDGIILQYGGATDAGGIKITDDGLFVWGAGDEDLITVANEDTNSEVFNIHNDGTATFQNAANSATAFQVQNTSSASLFTVSTSTNNVTILGNNSGEPQPWTTASALLPDGRVNAVGLTYNGFLYNVGGADSTTLYSTVNYSKIGANGAPGAWQTTSTLNTNVTHTSGVIANGYMYLLGGYTNGGETTLTTTVQYAKINTDGSLGTWSTSGATALPTAVAQGKAVYYGGYIYYVGGNTTSAASVTGNANIWYAKANPDGTLGSWTASGTTLPAGKGRSGVTIANGFLYVLGGETNVATETNTVYYAKFDNDTNGGLGSFTSDTDTLPAAVSGGGAYVMNGYIYSVGGRTAADATDDEVWYSALSSTGDVAAFSTAAAANKLTVGMRQFSYAQANGYIYAIGGYDGAQQDETYYTSLTRLTVGGSLDLVGLSGENLAEGGSGGNLTAGNARIVGTLQVSDTANFLSDVVIEGNLRVGEAALFKNRTNSATAFQVQNASGTNMFTVDTTNARLYVGPVAGDTVGTILVLGNKTNAGDPTGVDGAMYYNSSAKKFRCYSVDHWRDCVQVARTRLYVYSDFMAGQVNAGGTADEDFDFYGSSSGTGLFDTELATAVAGRPGIGTASTGTGTTGRLFLGSKGNHHIVLGNNDTYRFETAVSLSAVSDGTDPYTFRAGFIDSGSGESTDGCFFRYTHSANSGKWLGVCRSNNVETASTCDTGTTVAAATWYRLNVIVNAAASSVDFQINGTSACQVTANIPASSARATGYGTQIVKGGTGSTARSFDIDYMEVVGDLATAR